MAYTYRPAEYKHPVFIKPRARRPPKPTVRKRAVKQARICPVCGRTFYAWSWQIRRYCPTLPGTPAGMSCRGIGAMIAKGKARPKVTWKKVAQTPGMPFLLDDEKVVQRGEARFLS